MTERQIAIPVSPIKGGLQAKSQILTKSLMKLIHSSNNLPKQTLSSFQRLSFSQPRWLIGWSPFWNREGLDLPVVQQLPKEKRFGWSPFSMKDHAKRRIEVIVTI
jgi:hypothetical protein